MTNDFGKRVYPVIRYLFDLLAQIRERRLTTRPELVAAELRTLLGQFDVQGSRRIDYQLARAALVYWIDELLVNSPWEQAIYWSDHTLERSYFDARERAWRFFEKAEAARGLDNLDALETYYLCACFGFRGVYRDASAGQGRVAAKDSGDTWDEEQDSSESASAAKSADQPPADDDWWGNDDISKTWGIGGDDNSQSLIADVLNDASLAKGPLPLSAARRNAATFEEWIDSVYRQLAPAPQPPYVPAQPPSSLGPAAPLGGRSARAATTLMVVLAFGLTIVLWIALLYQKSA